MTREPMKKEKFTISFHVEMTEKNVWELAYLLEYQRHRLNEQKKWDVSQDIPNFEVKRAG
jgi:hypothetical protein